MTNYRTLERVWLPVRASQFQCPPPSIRPTTHSPGRSMQPRWNEAAQLLYVSSCWLTTMRLGDKRSTASFCRAAAQMSIRSGTGTRASPNRRRQIHAREEVDRILLEQVETGAIPLLAICFGLQSLNVYRGGTLVQHSGANACEPSRRAASSGCP